MIPVFEALIGSGRTPIPPGSINPGPYNWEQLHTRHMTTATHAFCLRHMLLWRGRRSRRSREMVHQATGSELKFTGMLLREMNRPPCTGPTRPSRPTGYQPWTPTATLPWGQPAIFPGPLSLYTGREASRDINLMPQWQGFGLEVGDEPWEGTNPYWSRTRAGPWSLVTLAFVTNTDDELMHANNCVDLGGAWWITGTRDPNPQQTQDVSASILWWRFLMR